LEYIGYISSVLIGVSLGLIGGGGSILTVPVLVYLFSVDPLSATAYSLFIVGLTSLIGSYAYYRNGLINIKFALVFGAPSVVAVFITRAFIIPAIPKTLVNLNGFEVSRDMFIMLLFSALMIAAAYSMIKKDNKIAVRNENKFNYGLVITEGLIVGALTGLVGAGGGFLIIPALVILGRLPMKEAVGTSLLIIAAKSLIGFAGESNETVINWFLLATVSAAAITGIIIGTGISKKINGSKLKPAFGWFVLLMGVYIIITETTKI
jgi:uncharacterized membrane protein YfcA